MLKFTPATKNDFVFLNIEFLWMVDKLVAEFSDLSCVSWGRSPQRNKAVGGAAQSGHVLWCAVDLVCDNARSVPQVLQRAMELGFRGIELDLENNHIHLDHKSREWRVVRYSDKREEPLSEYLASLAV